jgi:hypothetical protein
LQWYHLEGCKHGELHLKVCWLDLSTDPVDRERDEWESEWLGADKPMHPALLMVYVDSVSNLPVLPFLFTKLLHFFLSSSIQSPIWSHRHLLNFPLAESPKGVR